MALAWFGGQVTGGLVAWIAFFKFRPAWMYIATPLAGGVLGVLVTIALVGVVVWWEQRHSW